jgi:hypothetical protein
LLANHGNELLLNYIRIYETIGNLSPTRFLGVMLALAVPTVSLAAWSAEEGTCVPQGLDDLESR